jgi:hypothetical protein
MSDQDVIFTATAKNIAQIINGRVSTDADGKPTIYAEDYAAAAVDVLREARIPSGIDRAAAWDAAVAMLHNDVRAAIIAFSQDAIFAGEGACVAREEAAAAWEAQIKAAPMPAPAPTEWSPRAPVGSVWRFASDGMHCPAVAMGLDRLSSNPSGVFGVVREHVAIASFGETFVHADAVLMAFPSGPSVVLPINALVWAAKRVDA